MRTPPASSGVIRNTRPDRRPRGRAHGRLRSVPDRVRITPASGVDEAGIPDLCSEHDPLRDLLLQAVSGRAQRHLWRLLWARGGRTTAPNLAHGVRGQACVPVLRRRAEYRRPARAGQRRLGVRVPRRSVSLERSPRGALVGEESPARYLSHRRRDVTVATETPQAQGDSHYPRRRSYQRQQPDPPRRLLVHVQRLRVTAQLPRDSLASLVWRSSEYARADLAAKAATGLRNPS